MKRSQITVFIILGIILLLSFVLLTFLFIKKGEFKQTEIIPENIMPVKRYLESCINDIAKEGLLIQGRQGGFIELPSQIRMVRPSYISLGKNGVQKIPLWYYNGESRMPDMQYMEQELEKYIRENIDMCINGLSMFNQFVIKNSTSLVSITYGDVDVIADVELPIVLKDKMGGKETNLKEFGTVIPIKMGAMYKLAKNIYEKEMSSWYLENVTMELMTSDEEFPFTGMEIFCGTKKWYVKDLKERLQKIIYYNFQRIRIKGTNHIPFSEPIENYEIARKKAVELQEYLKKADYDKDPDPFATAMEKIDLGHIPEDMYEYTHFYFDPEVENPDLIAKILYEEPYGLDLFPNPSEGGVMSSKMMKGPFKYLRFFCLNFYHFAYDVHFPVEVRIIDKKALPLEGGFVFRYGLPVSIRNNMGYKDERRISPFKGQTASYNFCEQLTLDPISIIAKGLDEGYTNQPLVDVNLTYVCVRHYCELGQTELKGGTYQYLGKVPSSCSNALILAQKEGFLDAEEILTDNEIEIPMKKLKTMNISLKKIRYTDGKLESNPLLLANDEIVVLMFEFLNPEHFQYLHLPFNEQNPTKGLDIIEEGGIYSINALLIKDDEAIGGYIDTNLTITYEELAEKSTIEFTLIEFSPVPKEEEEIAKMMTYIYEGSYNKDIPIQFIE
jgi:hypothetical protein